MPDDSSIHDDLIAAGRRALDLLADDWDGRPGDPVLASGSRDELRALFAETLDDEGVGMERAIDDFARLVLPNSMRTPNPMYWGLVNTSPLPAGMIGDLLVSMLNNNGGAFEQGPAVWAAEQEIVRAFNDMLGVRDWSGLLLPGGSYANLHSLLLARTTKCPEWHKQGPAGVERNPILYVTDSSHFCTSRAAIVAGFGSSNIVHVPTTGRSRMDTNALAQHLEQDTASPDRQPIAVAASFGTTGTGALDPIDEIADLCQAHKVWLHVDACYGGGLLLLDEFKEHCKALRRADSIAIDPHKWFYMPMTAAIVLTPHAQIERETFHVDASYIPKEGSNIEGYQRSVTTSRRALSLMIWLAVRAHGWNTIADAVRRNIELTRLFERRLIERGFDVMPDGELSIACARWIPQAAKSLSPERLDDLQERIARRVVESGIGWFATTRHHDQTWLRFNILNLHTREEHVNRMVEAVHESALALAG